MFPIPLEGQLRTHMHHLVEPPLSGRCRRKELFQPSCDFLIFCAAFLLLGVCHLVAEMSVSQGGDVAQIFYEQLAGDAVLARIVLSLTFYNLYIVR